MRKRLLALGMTVALLLTGCAGNEAKTEKKAETKTDQAQVQDTQVQAENSEEGQPAVSAQGSVMTRDAEGTEITSWSWNAPEFNAKIEDYVKEAAGVTVNGQTMGREDLISKLTVSSATGKGMDIF